MKKITELTQKQKNELEEFKVRWLKIGLSTERTDRATAERVMTGLYRRINESQPYYWHCDSPMQAQLIINILQDNLGVNLGVNLGDNLEDNLGDNLRDNLGVNLWDNLGVNLWDNLWANLRDNLWANLGDNLGANLWDNLRDNLRDNLWVNLWDNLQANLGANLGDNLGVNLQDNLRANLRVNLWANLWDNLGDNLEDNLRANLRDNLRDNLQDNLWANLWDNLRANLQANLQDNLQDNLRDNKKLTYTPTSLWGSMDAYWAAYYLFCGSLAADIYKKEDAKHLNEWADLSKSAGWIYTFKNICFICDRPTSIKKDDEARLHCENGPAVKFNDGHELYAWHGTNIPGNWIKAADELTPEIALKWDNIEQRRCACEILGWDKILVELNPTIIDKHADPQIGELIEVDLPDSGVERFLKVKCGTGRDFAIPVPPDMKTAGQANAWTYGLNEDDYIIEVRT